MKRYPEEWGEFIEGARVFTESLYDFLKTRDVDFIHSLLSCKFDGYVPGGSGYNTGLLYRLCTHVEDKDMNYSDILSNRYRGYDNDEIQSYLRYTIATKTDTHSIVEMVIDMYNDFGNLYLDQITARDAYSLLTSDNNKMSLIGKKGDNIRILFTIYYLMNLEYYIYHLKDLCINCFDSLQEYTIADATLCYF